MMTTAARTSPKGLISKTMAVRVRYKSLYISFPSSAKQQREMINFCVVYGMWMTTADFSYFRLELNTVVAYSLSAFLEPLPYGADVDNREFRL